MRKYIAWKIYICFLYVIAALFALMIAYFLLFTSVWTGVDGELELAAALLYLFCAVNLIAFSHIISPWLQRRPTAMRRYLIVFWILAGISLTTMAITIRTASIVELQATRPPRSTIR